MLVILVNQLGHYQGTRLTAIFVDCLQMEKVFVPTQLEEAMRYRSFLSHTEITLITLAQNLRQKPLKYYDLYN